MPEYIFVFIASGIFSTLALASRKFDLTDRRIDAIELKMAERYLTKDEFNRRWDTLIKVLMRLEDKVDAHVSEDQIKIDQIKRKYDL